MGYLLVDSDSVPISLNVEVGDRRIPVAVSSLQFRRALATAARICARSHDRQHATAGLSPFVCSREQMAKVCKEALFYLLIMQIRGACWTSILREYMDEFERQADDEQLTPWERLLAVFFPARLPAHAKYRSRRERINQAARRCHLPLLSKAIADFEEEIEGQRSTAQVQVSATDTAAICLPRPKAALVRTPVPWRDTDPPLVVGRDKAFFGFSALHPSKLNNTLVLGGTGSGKTESALSPLLGAMLAYQLTDGNVPAMLVVDPKRELEAKVRRILSERGELDRLVVVGECPPLRIFTSGCTLSPSDRLAQLSQFAPEQTSIGENAYWRDLGQAMLLDWLQLEEAYAHKTNGLRFARMLAKELDMPPTSGTGYWPQLRDLLAYIGSGHRKLVKADQALRNLCNAAGVMSPALQVLANYTGDAELIRQWCYCVMSAQPTIAALANPDLEHFVDLDVLPGAGRPYTDVAALIDQGKVIVFCPEPSQGHQVAGKAIKQKFYESVFNRQDLLKPVFIVIDEAQSYLTQSETALVDKCRAYRAMVVMATQSIASLKHALGSTAAAQLAVDIFCANTPTKFTFRTTDADTAAWLRSQIPQPSDGDPHVIDIRRPASLKQGEAYFLLADGVWGRKRAHLADLA